MRRAVTSPVTSQGSGKPSGGGSYSEALRASAKVREMRRAPEGAAREEITSGEGRRHVLVHWTVPAEEAEGGAGYDVYQVFRASQVGKNNRARGGARPILAGFSFERWRHERSLRFVRERLAADELY